MYNPTDEINVSFNDYVSERTQKLEKHIEGGVPDYSYAMDYILRQKINAMPGAYKFLKAVTDYIVPRQKQVLNMQGIKVTPNQFPKIYDIVKDCANTLGIGIPTVYVLNAIQELNAGAYCTDDGEALIQINSAMIERTTEDELKSVIGHECGHVHNNHMVYNSAVSILGAGISYIPGLNQLLRLASLPLQLALQAWSRAAEVTCDRAAIICCGNVESTISVDTKLASGGLMKGEDLNPDEFIKQYDMLKDTPVRLLELNSTHPITIRRILANKEFIKSEVYYQWHPEQKEPDMKLYTKQELDSRCDKFISVTKKEKR